MLKFMTLKHYKNEFPRICRFSPLLTRTDTIGYFSRQNYSTDIPFLYQKKRMSILNQNASHLAFSSCVLDVYLINIFNVINIKFLLKL